MINKFFDIPDTFAPEDRRRRGILNAIILVCLEVDLLGLILTIIIKDLVGSVHADFLIRTALATSAVMGVLLFANRSPRIPGWLSAILFISLLIGMISQVDTPQQLYDGRSLITWVLPIMIGAVIFPPESVFIIAAVISGLIQVSAPANGDVVNYYAMFSLLLVAFVSWLGMTIANRAIADARHEAANKEAILNNIVDGVLVLDLQGNFLSANAALLQMIPEQDLKQLVSKPLEKTARWKRKVFSVTPSPVPEVGTVAVFRDETRRREAERARDALLATASHELRTPLAAVMNYLELLLMLVRLDRVNTAEFSEHLTRALENNRRLQGLVNDILDQAQIQAGVLDLKLESFSLRELLGKVHDLLDGLIQQKQLSYELYVAPDVPEEITGDPERLHQVLVNLIGNAIKFTNHGEIRVKVTAVPNDRLSIEVADTGQGIPPEQLPDIFEAFRRGSNYAQRERQGAGLGLSIAREIVNRMGGEISAVSEPGSGSTFTVTLPLEAL